jgi:hypothetical protein
LVMVWDIQKSRHERMRRERRLLASLREELRTNLGILRANHDLLRRENALARTNRSILKPWSRACDGCSRRQSVRTAPERRQGDVAKGASSSRM